jgi:3-oxoadipate enol-lactonase
MGSDPSPPETSLGPCHPVRSGTRMPRLRIRDAELYYENLGQGPSLLFIHGLGSSTRDWEAQLAGFSPRFHVVAFDVRGHGP